MAQNVDSHTFECSYPLEYNICHKIFNSSVIGTPKINRSCRPCFYTSYMQGKSEHILAHSHFLVTLPPSPSAAIYRKPTRWRGKFWQCDFPILGHIWLNLSKIGDIYVSHLSEPQKKITARGNNQVRILK